MAVNLRAFKKNIRLKKAYFNIEKQKQKQPVQDTTTGTAPTDNNKKVKLEFPYDDLELLYEYTLKEMGIKNPFE